MLLWYFGFAVVFITTDCVCASDADDDEVTELLGSCLQLLNPELVKEHCCVTSNRMIHDHTGDHMKKTCKLSEDKEFSCDDAKCVLQTMDVWDESKKEVNEEKVIKRLNEYEKQYGEMQGMLQKMKERCLDGKYKNMLPDDLCLPLKYTACVYLSAATSCPEWKNNDACKKMPEHAEKCSQIIDSI